MRVDEVFVVAGLVGCWLFGLWSGHFFTWRRLYREVVDPLRSRAVAAEELLARERAWRVHFKARAESSERTTRCYSKVCEGYYRAIYGEGAVRPLRLDADLRAMCLVRRLREGVRVENRLN